MLAQRYLEVLLQDEKRRDKYVDIKVHINAHLIFDNDIIIYQ